MSYEISLSKLVENRDTGLYGRLAGIREIAQPLLSYTHSKFPYYTPHDFSHSMAVEENLNWLIPDEVKIGMHTFELFFLIVAAWLHDWGMVAESDEDAELVRETHHIRTEINFEKFYDKLRLSEHEARIIGRISKGHRRVDLSSNEYDDIVFGQSAKIRRRFLASLLRVADECDITHNRTPEVIYFSIHPQEDAEAEFNKHLSIGGVGQLSETHKIYISAIARDPRGARTLREVAQKIQGELDSVKAFLSEQKVPLDVVELRLETRGFIDKPISFEMDRARIVQLLIGDHLYANQDVAIRELVQNSLDSCKLKQALAPDAVCKISLQKRKDGTLVVSDNGLGMDYIEAKQFLSTIGCSFRNSEDFRQRFASSKYSPIAQYGIGILSCFLICNRMIIETHKEGHAPCKFTIETVANEWRYEKGSLQTTGTQITLRLNEHGQEIKLRESLERYFLCPEIPVEFKDGDTKRELFHSEWSANFVFNNFVEKLDEKEQGTVDEVLKLSGDKYDIILATSSTFLKYNIVLLNHGIFVGGFRVSGLNHRYFICINMHTDLVDLLMSREGVKENDRWRTFIRGLFNHVFNALRTMHDNKIAQLIGLISSMIDGRSYLDIESDTSFLDRSPFVRSFLDNAPFLMLANGDITSVHLKDAMVSDNILLYNCCSNWLSDELELVSKLSSRSSLLINPYRLPHVNIKGDANSSVGLLPFLLTKDSKLHSEVDLRTLLIESSSEADSEPADFLPKHVRLATFPKGVKPLVVVKENPIVETHQGRMGASYWGNILLWKQLIHRERVNGYLAKIEEFYDDRYANVKLIENLIVYVDRSDSFVKCLLSARQRGALNRVEREKMDRYFKYLSYLPLVISNMASCLIFLEAIDQLEAELSSSMKKKRPPSVFARMKPSSKLFLTYFERFGLDYTEKRLK